MYEKQTSKVLSRYRHSNFSYVRGGQTLIGWPNVVAY